LWNVDKLKEKPSKDWMDAVLRWCEESQHKRSLFSDKSKFRWLDPPLHGVLLADITRDRIEKLSLSKLSNALPLHFNHII